MIAVGLRVRLRARGAGDVGTVRELVAPKGRKRALVSWDSDGCDQFVDLDKLAPALDAPAARVVVERCAGCDEPAHASETDDDGYHPQCRPAALDELGDRL